MGGSMILCNPELEDVFWVGVANDPDTTFHVTNLNTICSTNRDYQIDMFFIYRYLK